jgi:hypothetical protein
VESVRKTLKPEFQREGSKTSESTDSESDSDFDSDSDLRFDKLVDDNPVVCTFLPSSANFILILDSGLSTLGKAIIMP